MARVEAEGACMAGRWRDGCTSSSGRRVVCGARAVASGRAARGVLICGSGIGMAMSANRVMALIERRVAVPGYIAGGK